MNKPYLKQFPDEKGFFGKFGGSFVPDSIQQAMDEINTAYNLIAQNSDFIAELRKIRETFQGRPTPIYFAHNLTKKYGGAGIYLKREDLNHTGAHKLNHCMGEALLAKFMGKKKLIAETGAGQHGVAIATAAAYFGLECEIHMGEVDIAKEHPNVVRMRVLGAKVIAVTAGAKTLKEAVDSAFESYLKDPKNAMYAIGSVVGPHPFPKMVRDFQAVVGVESRKQFLEMTGELPDIVCACVGGGSNAMGIFSGFIEDAVELVGIEPLGRGSALGEHAASLSYGSEGVMHGFNSIMLKDSQDNPAPVYSVASGLDYPSVGPEHAYLHSIGRTKVAAISDKEAIAAFFELSKNEGIIPAIESSHALAYALKIAPDLKGQKILVNLSGRGDKDIDFVVENFGYGE
ncbi:tryptophan synthase subunit beta [Helicobacter sp. MIT 05-5294]|uniref:tryptophan synthase subunit beta n=1 Tax=Helicobacter sp. MIT 05-5294 TaxID=1548150 RepID=UPI0010FD08D2|nr:tryptophan synthase subunit beta [Helicobacter sp. MIT 05-5294]TLD86539.1 tryptophan synthase subunit beta [Helicobacter sp. MIT 05-5294]